MFEIPKLRPTAQQIKNAHFRNLMFGNIGFSVTVLATVGDIFGMSFGKYIMYGLIGVTAYNFGRLEKETISKI